MRQESYAQSFSHRTQTEDGRRRFWEFSEALAEQGVQHLVDAYYLSDSGSSQVAVHFEDYDRAIDPSRINLFVVNSPATVDPGKLFAGVSITVDPQWAARIFAVHCRLRDFAINFVTGEFAPHEALSLFDQVKALCEARDRGQQALGHRAPEVDVGWER